MKKISIVIVTYNSIELIKDCIDSINKYNDLSSENVEIVIVDNSGENENNEMFSYLQSLYKDNIVLIKNSKNLGYGQGNNLGINNSAGDIICIMNPDVRFTQPLLKKVLLEFNLNRNLCLLGFKQRGRTNLSYYLKPEYRLLFISSIIVRWANRFNIFSEQYFYLSGAFFFIDKEKFERIGKFDDNIFMYFEEPDISNRILGKGYSIKYVSKYKYHHFEGNRTNYTSFPLKNSIISLNYYLNKFGIDKIKYFKKTVFELQIYLLLAKLFRNKVWSKQIVYKLNLIRERILKIT